MLTWEDVLEDLEELVRAETDHPIGECGCGECTAYAALLAHVCARVWEEQRRALDVPQ